MQFHNHVELDLSDLSFMDSTGLALIVEISRQISGTAWPLRDHRGLRAGPSPLRSQRRGQQRHGTRDTAALTPPRRGGGHRVLAAAETSSSKPVATRRGALQEHPRARGRSPLR